MRPSNRLMSFMAGLGRTQVKAKALATFGQIALNVTFNCSMAFPASFERTLFSIKIVNLELMLPWMQCKLSNFDYLDTMVFVTVPPLFLVVILGLIFLFQLAIARSQTPSSESKCFGSSRRSSGYF